MNEYGFLIAIAGVLLIGAMSPGPSFLVVAQNALSKSRSHGIATAVGTALGVALFAVLASFGVTALIERVPVAFLTFRVVGGLFLIYLAYQMWRTAHIPLDTSGAAKGADLDFYSSFLKGLLTQCSNPKTIMVIAGIFAAFIPSQPPPNTAWLVALIAFTIDFSWYAVVAFGFSIDRVRQGYKRAKSGFDRCAALFLLAVAVKLLLF